MDVRTSLIAVVCAFTMGASPSAAATALPDDPPDVARCIQKASVEFGIPELPLWVILDVERGTLGQVSQNTNATYDIGPMQINSIWLPRLEQRFGITENDVLNDLCTNIFVGAWIYTQEYIRLGSTARAIAHYHSPTPRHQHRYLGMIEQAIERRLRRIERSEQQRASAVAMN